MPTKVRKRDKSKQPLPSLPSHKVVSEIKSGQVQGDEAFVFCSDYGQENYDQYRKEYKLKTDYKYGNMKDKYDIEFERKVIKETVHIITVELKRKGMSLYYYNNDTA
ncbi:unnamed protein product [Ambrosiozyma monospora]|uniref:Unnamed protein product n=1 Tax=Ambrosiozyma monospora TaxID=43982 RepID=A0ACB5TBS6_AMBMO|nr:unnamed protein product [Ambrosiozyma monospora]